LNTSEARNQKYFQLG
jgi:hypothetical protein